MDAALDGTPLTGGAFNIGSTEEVSIQSLQQAVFEAVAADSTWRQAMPEVQHEDGYHGDVSRRLPNCSEAEARLGWKPTTSLNQGLTLMWNSLR
jgi:nucleoside-diphosphate-sugar epimerase